VLVARAACTAPSAREPGRGAQIRKRIDLVDGNQASDAAAAHGHDHLAAVPDVLDIAAEPVVQLADAHLRFQRLGM
jgi:hypothetical protein